MKAPIPEALHPMLMRVFAASVCFDADGLTKQEKLYLKARELIAGDRAEIMTWTGNGDYRKDAWEDLQ